MAGVTLSSAFFHHCVLETASANHELSRNTKTRLSNSVKYTRSTYDIISPRGGLLLAHVFRQRNDRVDQSNVDENVRHPRKQHHPAAKRTAHHVIVHQRKSPPLTNMVFGLRSMTTG